MYDDTRFKIRKTANNIVYMFNKNLFNLIIGILLV